MFVKHLACYKSIVACYAADGLLKLQPAAKDHQACNLSSTKGPAAL